MFARRRPNRRPAAATVEFAVVLPVLLLFVLGILELGRLVMVAQMASNAAREGTRYAAQGTADAAAVDQYVRGYLTAAGIRNAGQTNVVAVAIEAQTGAGATWLPAPSPPAVTSGTAVRVTVSINFAQQSWLPTQFIVGSNTQVQGAAVMRRE